MSRIFPVIVLFQLLTRGSARENSKTIGIAKGSGTACSSLGRKRSKFQNSSQINQILCCTARRKLPDFKFSHKREKKQVDIGHWAVILSNFKFQRFSQMRTSTATAGCRKCNLAILCWFLKFQRAFYEKGQGLEKLI